MWEVMRRAGESLLGLWALIAGLAEGVRDPEGYICLYVSLSNFPSVLAMTLKQIEEYNFV